MPIVKKVMTDINNLKDSYDEQKALLKDYIEYDEYEKAKDAFERLEQTKKAIEHLENLEVMI